MSKSNLMLFCHIVEFVIYKKYHINKTDAFEAQPSLKAAGATVLLLCCEV
jgi:hypothetical protein